MTPLVQQSSRREFKYALVERIRGRIELPRWQQQQQRIARKEKKKDFISFSVVKDYP